MKFEKQHPSEQELETLGVNRWSIWKKEISEFAWEYDNTETFFVLEGEAEIVSEGETVSFGPGDLVTCHSGVLCTWKITKPIKKHYRFE